MTYYGEASVRWEKLVICVLYALLSCGIAAFYKCLSRGNLIVVCHGPSFGSGFYDEKLEG